jgi:hypothetical protein
MKREDATTKKTRLCKHVVLENLGEIWGFHNSDCEDCLPVYDLQIVSYTLEMQALG